MVVCIAGKVEEINLKSFKVREMNTNQLFECDALDDSILDLDVDYEGIFVGTLINNTIKIKRIELRKFLEPLYEQDLHEVAAKFTTIPVINDPFTEAYQKFISKENEEPS